MNFSRCTISVVFLAITLSQRLSADVTPLHSESRVEQWLLDEGSGRIFASLAEDRKIVEFSPVSQEIVRTIPLAGRGLHMVVKGNHLVVAVEAPGAPRVITYNLEENKPHANLSLPPGAVRSLFCSKAENPFVYVHHVGSPGANQHNVLQLDIIKGKTRKTVDMGLWNPSLVNNITMSNTGRSLITDDRRTNDYAHYVRLFDVDEERATLRVRGEVRGRVARPAAGPAGRFWVAGNKLMDLDLKKEIRLFPGYPVAFHPLRDLVVCLVQDRSKRPVEYFLGLQSFTGSKLVGRIPLKALLPDDSIKRRQVIANHEPVLYMDPRNDRVLVAWGDRAAMVSMASTELPSRPLVLLEIPTVAPARVAQPLRLALTLSNPELLKKTRFLVDSGPAGLKVSGSDLIWTPPDSAVGMHNVRIRAVVDGTEDTADLRVDVMRPAISLGMAPHTMVVGPAGRRVLLVSGMSRRARQSGQTRSKISVVDVERRKLLFRKTWEKRFSAVHIDEKFIYLASDPGGFFYVFQRDTMDFVKRVFVESTVSGFGSLPGGKLAVVLGGKIQVYDKATMQAVDNYPGITTAAGAYTLRGESRSPVVELNDGLLSLGHRVVDGTTGELRMLTGGSGLPELYSLTRPHSVLSPTAWNRVVNAGKLFRRTMSGGQPTNVAVATWNARATVLLRNLPVAVSLLVNQSHDKEPTESVQLEFRDLIEGTVQEEIRLAHHYVPVLSRSRYASVPLLDSRSGRVLAVHDQKLYVTPVPERLMEKLPRPLQFKARLQPIEVGVAEPSTITFEATGGKGRLRYELLHKASGLELNSSTGSLVIDMPAIWKDYLGRVREGKVDHRYGRRFPPVFERIPSESIYHDLAGRRLPEGKAALALPVHLGVTDEEAQGDQLVAYMLVLGPKADLESAVKDREATRLARMEEVRRRQEKRRSTLKEKSRSRQAEGIEARLQDIQSMLERIEKRLEGVEDRLERLEKKSAKKSSGGADGEG